MRKRLLTLLPAFAATFLVVGGFAWAATTNLDSLRVGTAGEGGVTFFNGSIVNESGPVVVADDFRVDGVITRLDGTADKPVRVNDEFNVTGDVTLDEDLAVTGDVTAANLYTKTEADARYVSDSSPSWDAQTGYATASVLGFMTSQSTDEYSITSGNLTTTLGDPSSTFYGEMQLPHGATLTSFELVGLDNNNSNSSLASLVRVPNTGDSTTNETVFSVNTGDDGESADYRVFEDVSPLTGTEVVDNDGYTYHVRILVQDDDDLALRSVRANYTYTAPY